MEKIYNKELFFELLNENSNLNNVEIAKLYNEQEGTNHDLEQLRKAISKFKNNNSDVNAKNNFNSDTKKLNDTESLTKVNCDKGTLESVVESTFEPKDHLELSILHKIDLTKYKISSYWSKLKSNGKFTSSVFCTERKLGDSVSLDEIKSALSDVMSNIRPYAVNKLTKTNNKSLFLFVADEHVGASVESGLYDNTWNASEYFNRKSALINVVREQGELHGNFDSIIYCNLGDTMDGFNGQTTRGGHKLKQNMTNKEAIKTYVEVNKIVWDEIIKLRRTDTYKIYNVENSNHGGFGWDASANLALEMYLKTQYPNITVTGFEKLIESFSYGKHNFHLSHGKDEEDMKRNMPLHIDKNIEIYIKQYLDDRNFNNKNETNNFCKGDLHQFATEQGKFFSYTNIPSLFGGSNWVSHNIGKSKPGFCYAIVPKDSSEFSYIPVWL